MDKTAIREGFIQQEDGYFTSTEYPLIRYKEVTDEDPLSGVVYDDFRFEIFVRPYFFNLLGKKRWEYIVQTSSFSMGFSFSYYMTKPKKR